MLAFIKKECLHVIRDMRMMLVVMAIPVILMLLFGFAISTEVNNVNVAVSFEQYNEDVRKSCERLAGNPFITMIGSLTPREADDALRRGEVDAVVVFGRDAVPQILTDASNPNIAQTAAMYITTILQTDMVAKNPMAQAQLRAIPNIHYLYNPLLLSAYNFAPAIMGMVFLLVCSLMTAVSIVREKETGTMEVLLVSPVKPIQIIVSKMVPFLILSCIDLAIILVIARYILGVPMSAGVWPIIIVSLLYIVLSLAIGLFVSAISKSQVTAILICGMVMILPVIMLSGMIFPIDNLPIVMHELSYVIPARWYIDAIRKMMVMGQGFGQVWPEITIMAVMTILIFAVALRKFKDRL